MLPITVLLDTNVLYHALDYGIQIKGAVSEVIDRNYEIFVHTKVQQEIMSDLTNPNKRGRQAKFAVQLMKEFQPYNDDRDYPGTDTALLRTARRVNGVVFTFDKELRDRCNKENIPVITHHSSGRVQLLGYIE